MNVRLFFYVSLIFWCVMSLYWIITAKHNSQASMRSEMFPLLKLLASAFIVYAPMLTKGWFAVRLYEPGTWTDIAGIIVCSAGVGLAIWSRYCLGKNWSGKVRARQNHQLIDTGPYHFIRHPIYLGVLLALLGTALGLAYVFSFLYLALSVFGLVRKARQEEALLLKILPDEYAFYKHKSKMLIPFLF